jgi:pimeloyl-ACP methyl ester carboxylesterase
LFIHGSFCGAWIWAKHFLPYFADAGWECVALSLRGHGYSEGREHLDQFGLADYVADVTEAASQLDRPPVVIGHSLGGLVAQRFACRHPTAGLVVRNVSLAFAPAPIDNGCIMNLDAAEDTQQRRRA